MTGSRLAILLVPLLLFAAPLFAEEPSEVTAAEPEPDSESTFTLPVWGGNA